MEYDSLKNPDLEKIENNHGFVVDQYDGEPNDLRMKPPRPCIVRLRPKSRNLPSVISKECIERSIDQKMDIIQATAEIAIAKSSS